MGEAAGDGAPFELATGARLRADRRRFRRGAVSPFTSARNLAIVSVPTATSTVASNSRMRRSEAPFWRNSTMPSLSGMSFA